ncbi:MAG: hypothetical protein U0L71_03455 [Eggerthellaceae bacterium]|nr:hypothetical protein [Eggerthellaceae bacterium]
MELGYRKLLEIEKKIVNYKEKLQQIISYEDGKGKRKLNPIFFLGGEVAAYKVLGKWYKELLTNSFEYDDEKALILTYIENIFATREGDFSDKSTLECYEESNQLLWYYIFDDQYNQSVTDINYEIQFLANLLTLFPDTPYEELKYTDIYVYDDAAAGELYTETHQMIMGLPQDEFQLVLEVISGTQIYKYHFDVFQ